MVSGTVLREFNTLSLPSGYPSYAITFSFELWANSNQGTAGYASANFWDKGVFYLYDVGVISDTPPNSPTPLSPVNGAAASSPVTFHWNPSPDPAGVNSYT